MKEPVKININPGYADSLPDFCRGVLPTVLEKPQLLSKNDTLLKELKLNQLDEDTFTHWINGKISPPEAKTVAMVYSGHQFGHFVPQLGDGRALNIGKIGPHYLQTKGSGLTPFSRRGDGLAVLRSSIRAYLMAEAMHALGIPTSRSLALISSKKTTAQRQQLEPTAIVMRSATSWLRFGSFEWADQQENAKELLQQLVDISIHDNYPELIAAKDSALDLFSAVVKRTAKLIAQWQVYGFMHGVMNTDNMSIAGLTIDYGPFAMMDTFDWNHICNTTDQNGRYSFKNQPLVAHWNLQRLLSVLLPLTSSKKLEKALEEFYPLYQKNYSELLCNRLGLKTHQLDERHSLLNDLLLALQEAKVDYNPFFYYLSTKNLDDSRIWNSICTDPAALLNWLEKYRKLRIDLRIMKKVNPKYTLKNHLLQEAISLAEKEDFSLVNELLQLAQKPFDDHPNFEKYAHKTPDGQGNSPLSCSS